MARQVTVNLIDDLDETKPADETVTFAIDGTTYEIDLSATNARKLRTALTPFIESGRKTTVHKTRRRAASRPPLSPSAPIDREQSRKIREWAQGAGYQISDRGRISQEIIDAYNQAN